MNHYTATVPGFIRQLKALKTILQKGEVHTKNRREVFHPEGMHEVALLQSRIVFDQFPLVRQIQIATDNAKLGVARIAGIEAPVFEDNETTFAEIYARIDKTVTFLETVTLGMMTGKDDVVIGNPYWNGREMLASDYVVHHLVPNFYFHVAMAYAILRSNGVVLGKGDFFGERAFIL